MIKLNFLKIKEKEIRKGKAIPEKIGEKIKAEALKIKKGSKEPGRDIISSISEKQCEEIAEKKLKDLNANTVEQALKIIMGSARSMGIEVTK